MLGPDREPSKDLTRRATQAIAAEIPGATLFQMMKLMSEAKWSFDGDKATVTVSQSEDDDPIVVTLDA